MNLVYFEGLKLGVHRGYQLVGDHGGFGAWNTQPKHLLSGSCQAANSTVQLQAILGIGQNAPPKTLLCFFVRKGLYLR